MIETFNQNELTSKHANFYERQPSFPKLIITLAESLSFANQSFLFFLALLVNFSILIQEDSSLSVHWANLVSYFW